MAENKRQRKIFEYLDYRVFLKDYYNQKKKANPAFSLRVFSDKIGFKAKDFISRVMNGEKNLSSQSIPKVANGLRLGKHETEFFLALVEFNQAETGEIRDDAFKKMQATLKVVRFAEKQHLLGLAQYMVYSHPRHLIIRSLIGMYGFDGNYGELAKKVHPKITADEAKQSVKLLEECQLIKVDEQGKYQLTESAITTGDKASKLALRGFHQQCLKMGADSIDRDSPSKRHISGLTLGISQEGYEHIVERINAFRKEIALLAEEDKGSDKVFQMEFALFQVGGK
ncbi:MAG: TIGR02147 family protein [Fibrobacteraceae bacterium]|nr:TIGR02147 family protein [Fibrobacteraceae bacterium]